MKPLTFTPNRPKASPQARSRAQYDRAIVEATAALADLLTAVSAEMVRPELVETFAGLDHDELLLMRWLFMKHVRHMQALGKVGGEK